ncbi:hypothetical protein Asi03nite_44350 [Actinoplanes siamensis]|uniref:Uncharacterized protein n=1 Tax=Actinoplanes siamensis TaxID=1223317 RepID=A0A919N9A9_9ACTN|nr:hypothetical protein Asi03nite_44350 [Actinoplanes siamensis]
MAKMPRARRYQGARASRGSRDAAITITATGPSAFTTDQTNADHGPSGDTRYPAIETVIVTTYVLHHH